MAYFDLQGALELTNIFSLKALSYADLSFIFESSTI